jgi:hypothetical protein
MAIISGLWYFPEKSLFISNYANQIKQSQSEAIYGGFNIKIFNRKWSNASLGTEREAITVSRRHEQPYKTSLASNFLIQNLYLRQFYLMKL